MANMDGAHWHVIVQAYHSELPTGQLEDVVQLDFMITNEMLKGHRDGREKSVEIVALAEAKRMVDKPHFRMSAAIQHHDHPLGDA